MRRSPTISRSLLIGLILISTFVYSHSWESRRYKAQESVEWYCERLVPGAYPSPLGIPRNPLMIRLQEMIKLMRTVYVEISTIFEDGPTYIPTLEELLYRRKSPITKLPPKLREEPHEESKARFRQKLKAFFHKKRFFLNGRVS